MFSFFKKKAKSKDSEKKNSQKEKYIMSVMEKTGWDRSHVKEVMTSAKDRLGITFKDYSRYEFFNIPIEEQEKEYKKILERKERVKKSKEQRVLILMEKTGWDYEYAVKQIEDAKKRLGASYREYLVYELFNVPVEEQKDKYENILKRKERGRKKAKDKAINKTMEATGWDYGTADAKIEDARKRTGCTYNEYIFYKFYELEDAEQEEYFVAKFSREITAKYDVNNKFVAMLYNKASTNDYFKEYLKRPWGINTKISLEEFTEKFVDCKKIFYKPLGGHHGTGAEPFEVNRDNIKTVFDKIASYPEGVVEKYVVQHPKMSALSPAAVNTIRVVSISSTTQPVTSDGKYIDIAYASLKMGGVNSVVDNLVGGGMVAGVDLNTGKLITDAADESENVFSEHPGTGVKIKGFEIPFFKEALELVISACKEKKIDGYLGWDIAITEDGPELIEVNVVPGVILCSLPYVAEKKGMKSVMAKYL